MVTATATASPMQTGLFERKLPARVILASFPLLTVPLAAALALTTDRLFLMIYIWLFSLTHFVLTLTVYLQSENLKYFKATGRNIFLFFVVPLAILMGFYVIGVLQVNARFPAFALIFGPVVRILDFNHLNRQSFGVYQMFKARTGLKVSPVAKRAEQAYFNCLTVLLLTTFLAGGVSPVLQWLGKDVAVKPWTAILPIGALQAICCVAGALAVVFAAISVKLLLRAWKEGGRPGGVVEALSYMAIQTLAALLAVVSFPFYFATLATHYVEYHVMMFPRCFNSKLDEKSMLDRCFGVLRSRRVVFYCVTTLAAGVVMLFTTMGRSPAQPLRYLAAVSIFDGLFVFHYFVETLIWRFSDPFFRRTLSSLYFTPRLRASQGLALGLEDKLRTA